MFRIMLQKMTVGNLWKSILSKISGIYSLVFLVCFALMPFFITGNLNALECSIPPGTQYELMTDEVTNVSGFNPQYCDIETNCFSDLIAPSAYCSETSPIFCVAEYVFTGENCPITETPTVSDNCWEKYSACSITCANGISTFACSNNSCNCADSSGITTYTPNTPSSAGATIQTVVDSVNANHQASSNIANSMQEIKSLNQSSNATLVGIQNGITNSTSSIVSAIGSMSGGGVGGQGGEGGSVTIDLSPTNTKLDQIITNQEKIKEITDFPEITDAEIEGAFMGRFNSSPIIMAVSNVSVSFASASCSMPSGGFNLPVTNKYVSYNFNVVCDGVNDIKGILGAMMMFIYAFLSIRVMMGA